MEANRDGFCSRGVIIKMVCYDDNAKDHSIFPCSSSSRFSKAGALNFHATSATCLCLYPGQNASQLLSFTARNLWYIRRGKIFLSR